jgi:uncharacterized protein (TIGR01777 family)
MATILIGGGTGLVGQRLSELLNMEGHTVLHLSRTKDLDAKYPAYHWDLHRQTIDREAVEQADYLINLAGAGIADKPWTRARKQVIIESRTQSNALLRKAALERSTPPKAYIASAAIGIYGDRGDTLLTEESEPGQSGFLAESCRQWEAAIQDWMTTPIRTVGIRIGVVMANEGGALPKMMMSLPVGVAPYFGNGQAWYSWIHIDDLARLFIHAIKTEDMQGFYNGVAPHPVRNKDLVRAMVEAKKAKAVLVPAPAFALRLGMGEMADAVLSSARVSADKTESTGFTFKYPTIDDAFKALFTDS